MATPVSELMFVHSTNLVDKTDMLSNSSKEWTNEYPSISRLNVYTHCMDNGSVLAEFDATFYAETDDDSVRLAEPAFPPNARQHRLYSEEDGAVWFHTEISNVVLGAFSSWPRIVQTSHDPPKPKDTKSKILVDVAYTTQYGDKKVHLLLGEFKRNLIQPLVWQSGSLTNDSQLRLSRELRGYAHAYECPFVFCFDHRTLLLLQFRAASASDLKRDCEVDCWVIPRKNPDGISFRYALYRILVQGFRRFQGLFRLPPALPGAIPDGQVFFNGLPLWRVNGSRTASPYGYSRKVDPTNGALYWVDESGTTVLDANGNAIYDTMGFWG